MTDQRLFPLEQIKAQELARDYARRGYQVITDPTSMPKFLAGMYPDFVALSDTDKVVVEVKAGRGTPGHIRLHLLADVVSSQPDWRLELVMVEGLPPKGEIISTREIRSRLKDAASILATSPVAASLLIWTGIEALLRTLLGADGAQTEKMSPFKMIKTATAKGLISQNTSDLLLNAAELRNTVVHGLDADEKLLKPRAVGAFLRQAEDLLAQLDAVESGEPELASVEQMVQWFFENYEGPSACVPYDTAEGGYQYHLGGPYDASEVLSEQFPDASEEARREALDEIVAGGYQWVRKGQYP